MRYSQLIGAIAAIVLIVACFMPWSYIASNGIEVTGLKAVGTNFGKPGMFNLILTSVALIFFILPKIWAKRTNVFIGALNLAWSIRNFFVVTACSMGECPEKKAGLYLVLVCSIIIQVMTFLPKMSVAKPKD
jgi:membrane protease YdiL (CAAX protease family)